MYILRFLAKPDLQTCARQVACPTYKALFQNRRNDSTVAIGTPLLTKCIPTSEGDLVATKPYVNLPLSSGHYVRRQIFPSKTSNPSELVSVLNPLFNDPEYIRTSQGLTSSFGSLKWHLDRRGDAIHRFLMLANQKVAAHVIELIEEAAKEMNHHPHITEALGPRKRGREPMRLVTITCTTHSPFGLSMQDAKLAEKINQILRPFDTLNSIHSHSNENAKHAIRLKRTEMKSVNRRKIWNATGKPEMTMFGRSVKWVE